MGSGDITGDAVTGGYIFSIDKEADGWFSKYHPNNEPNAVIQFSYVYPKLEDIVPEQQQYIQSYVDSFENALAGDDFQDPVTGFRRFADEQSFIDYLIVNEISRNVDGYRLSSFFYKTVTVLTGRSLPGQCGIMISLLGMLIIVTAAFQLAGPIISIVFVQAIIGKFHFGGIAS